MMLSKHLMKLMESLFTDINDINYGCEKGKIDNKEFHRCVKSVMENTLEELESIKNNPYLFTIKANYYGEDLYTELLEYIK